MRYPTLPSSLVSLEEAVLERWREEDTFRRTLEATRDGEDFVFFEGPPTANGRPGLHHIISRAIKDLVCRYQTMLGRHVTRIAGWDTHGLPVEIEAQKAARDRGQAGDRGARHRVVQRALQGVRLHVQGRVGALFGAESATGWTIRGRT